MRLKPSRIQIWRNRLTTSRAAAKWRSFWYDTNFPMAIGLFAVCALITCIWWWLDPQDPSNLWPEMGGMTLDVFFILIVFALFEHRRNKRQDIARQREVIDDYKRWDHPEAHLRIAGAIRRLNRLGVFAIDFAGARLSDLHFAREGIGRLDGSTFFNGEWGQKIGDTSVILSKVNFSSISCRGVVFSPFNPLSGLGFTNSAFARFQDCSFNEADLSNAKFDGAEIAWTGEPPVENVEMIEEDDGGHFWMQTHYGPFDRADLKGASFKDCIFKNADFREAENVLKADFTGAKGLEAALFDNDEIRAAVLAQAAGGTAA